MILAFYDYLTRYMFVSSDTWDAWNDGLYVPVVLWALEGMSTSNWTQAVAWGKGCPWQVRCIRNLGTDLRDVTEADKTTPAYIVSEDSRIVELRYYDARSVRPTRLSGNGNDPGQMPAHDVTSSYNQGFGKFEYDDTDLAIPGEYWTLSRLKEYVETDPCSGRGDGWRIPNQKELAILKNIGVLSGNHLWLSCTYNYYNGTTGVAGGGFQRGETTFLGMLEDRGTQTTHGNIRDFPGRIRCVRDVR